MKISDLPLATEMHEGDQLPLVQDGVTKRIDAAMVGGSNSGMIEGTSWWGNGTQDVTLSSGIQGGVTRKVMPDANNTELCGDNGLGLFMYRNVIVNSVVNINGDFAIIMATESITITPTGELQIIRNPFQSRVPYAQRIPSIFHAQGRNAGHSLHLNDPNYSGDTGVSCSTGGGGGGGSGDGTANGGFWGDHVMHPTQGTSLMVGGKGGIGGANSAGFRGDDAPESGNLLSFKQAFNGGEPRDTIAPGAGAFSFNVPNVNSGQLSYISRPGHQSHTTGGGGLGVDIPIIPGGNGGPGGGSGDYSPANYGGMSGLGGGVIYLIAPKIVIQTGGHVRANGRAGLPHSSPHHFAAGGGGGGGGGMSVFICQQGAGSSLWGASIDTDPYAAWSSWPSGGAEGWYQVRGGDGGQNTGGWGGPQSSGGRGGFGTNMIRVIQPDGSVRLAH